MKIRRQHDETGIVELNGKSLAKAITVGHESWGEVGFVYLEVENEWYRFFIENEILFWDTAAPDPEEDLFDNEKYIEILPRLGIVPPLLVESIIMGHGELVFRFRGAPFSISFREGKGARLEVSLVSC